VSRTFEDEKKNPCTSRRREHKCFTAREEGGRVLPTKGHSDCLCFQGKKKKRGEKGGAKPASFLPLKGLFELDGGPRDGKGRKKEIFS